jgi:hypothetical protein
MEPAEYFARIYVLLCERKNIPPSPQPWFPFEYVSTIGSSKKFRDRRNKFYQRTREHYRLLLNEDNAVVCLEHLMYEEKIAIDELEAGESTVLSRILM